MHSLCVVIVFVDGVHDCYFYQIQFIVRIFCVGVCKVLLSVCT